MWLGEQLRRGLTETSNLVLDRLSHHRVGHSCQVHLAVVRQVVEDVGGAHSFRSALFVAEDEVDPLVQLAGNDLRLQSLKEENTSSSATQHARE